MQRALATTRDLLIIAVCIVFLAVVVALVLTYVKRSAGNNRPMSPLRTPAGYEAHVDSVRARWRAQGYDDDAIEHAILETEWKAMEDGMEFAGPDALPILRNRLSMERAEAERLKREGSAYKAISDAIRGKRTWPMTLGSDEVDFFATTQPTK
jgi:hypothetical protein